MSSYYIILTCRNSETTIGKTLDSIFNQTQKHDYIIVLNDGSTDSTLDILNRYKHSNENFHIISHPDWGYDVTRIVKNWNEALKYTKENKFPPTDYHMISSDDCSYSPTYAHEIITEMDSNKKLMAVSGEAKNSSNLAPRGHGRFIRNSIFKKTIWHGFYPEKMGYESAILYEAERLGYCYKIMENTKFEHLRPLGALHKFYEWGPSMKTLGYHPFYVISRFFKNLITGNETGRIGAMRMLYSFFTYKPLNDGYNSKYEEELRKYIRAKQLLRLKSLAKMHNIKIYEN